MNLRDARVRGALFGAGGVAFVLVVTQLILPGGTRGNGTPGAVLFNGAVLGMLNALLAVGIVLVHRSHRIVNFAQAAMGAVGGVMTYNFAALSRWPYMLAFVAGLFTAVFVAVAIELLFVRRFFNAPRLVLTVVTGGIVFMLSSAAGFVTTLPIFPSVQDRTIDELGGRGDVRVPFQGIEFTIGSLKAFDFGFEHLFAIGFSLVLLVGLGTFLRVSKLGTAVRASAENAERASLLGISVGMLSLTVWALAGLLGGAAVILTGTVQKQFGFFQDPFVVLLVPLAAAVLARFQSLPTAAVSSVALTVLLESLRYSYQRASGIRELGAFLIVLGGLLLQRERAGRSERADFTSWQAIQEQRPIPKEMLSVAGIGLWRRAFAVVGILAMVLVPWVTAPRQTILVGYYAIVGIVLLSLNVLTGWAGQVSWGQLGIVALGAVIGGAATSKWSVPFWIAIVLVPAVVAGLTMLVGLPALRIRGLLLGVVTLMFAYVVQFGLFNENAFRWLLPERIDRPTLFVLDFDDERSMYYLVIVAAVLMVFGVRVLRQTRVGRILIATRDNETNVQSFGVNVVRTRLAAFGLSGFIAGFAGVLMAHHQRAATDTLFPANDSFLLFVIAVVGGAGSTLGVILGAIYFAAQDLISNPIVKFIVGPIGSVFVLYAVPGGLAAAVAGMRDGVLRIVAQRRQLVVPSLFADYDPEALERKLIPLGPASLAGGLGSLPLTQRYRGDSDLYGARGRLVAVKERRSQRDALALGAAVEHFAGDAEEDQPIEVPVAQEPSNGGRRRRRRDDDGDAE